MATAETRNNPKKRSPSHATPRSRFHPGEVWVKSPSTGAQLQASGRTSGAPCSVSTPARVCQ